MCGGYRLTKKIFFVYIFLKILQGNDLLFIEKRENYLFFFKASIHQYNNMSGADFPWMIPSQTLWS